VSYLKADIAKLVRTFTNRLFLVGNPGREVQESKVTLGRVYGVLAVLILEANSSTGLMEVEVHLLNGPGLAPRKCHVLRLSLPSSQPRFAINTVDNLIVVHHQATATSLLFDIALSGEVINDVTYHAPITPARSIKPFALKLPSLSPDGQIMQCELCKLRLVNIIIFILIKPSSLCRFHPLGTVPAKYCHRCQIGLHVVSKS